MNSFVHNILLFARLLRRLDLDVHHGRLLDAIQALPTVGIRQRRDVRATLGALLVHRREDQPRFERAFDLFFRDRRRGGAPAICLPGESADGPERPPAAPLMAEAAAIEGEAGPAEQLIGAYSPLDVSRTKDFAEFTDRELDRARLLLEQLPWALGSRRTRRWRADAGTAVHLRPLIRQSLLHADVIDLPRRQRRIRPRPIVLLGDVSGSMERYSRMLLHFVAGLSRSDARVESFVFATRLTRLTPGMTRKGRARGVGRVIREVQDWGGGTRIGDALRTFNTRWARRVMRNGPVVLIVSDGWDRGEPAVLSQELARVRRNCRRLIWLNPLLGAPDYEPLTRGMQAALRHVDDFLPAHNLASLDALAAHLRDLPSGRSRAAATGRGIRQV